MDALIREGFILKQKIDEAQTRLKEINNQVAMAAEYQNGSKTGYIIGGGVQVKVSLRNNEKWDQEKLEQVRFHFPDLFDSTFKTQFKPIKKILSASPTEFQKAAAWACEVKPAAPTVTYELLEEEAA